MNVEALIDKATNKNNISEDWATIMDICDIANSRPENTVNYLKKKITDSNTNVILYALTVADALVKNCGKKTQEVISSRGFLDTIVKQINNRNVNKIAKQKMLFCIKQWRDAFENDPGLRSYCNEIYRKLRDQNYTFKDPSKSKKNDNDINNAKLKRKEEEDMQLALALSLSAEESKKNNKKSSSYSKKTYDSPSPSSSPTQSSQINKPLFKVKALYDFAGNYAEGELPLYTGDIINVYDTTYKDWWRGENRGMVGIFPNNYVEKIQETSTTQPVNEEYETQVLREAQKIDEFMQILSRVDPKTENLSENEELQNLYNSICTLRPKLVKLVEYYSKKMEEITLLSSKSYQSQEIYRNLYEQYQQQLYAPVQQPYAPYSQPQPQTQPQAYVPPQQQPQTYPPPQQPQTYPLPQQPQAYAPPPQPNPNFMMPMQNSQSAPLVNSQAQSQPQEMMPPQPNLPPTTSPEKMAYDPRLVQQPPPQQPLQQPQQPLYMQPYVNQGVAPPPPTSMDPGAVPYQNPGMPTNQPTY
ncbi:hypothetical protein H8356DRAFT_1625102 [Neocallimastix lanati (nom. inval.)]|jgi:signal transducing adaptor molecule|uniref:Class E vacuolar protein-sorting machinery protein HSE1 n=1 Tax=Neocallimastix californiae TaxID=1754190 RepID=A0A1Y2EUI7_9FUNG|nr:hypothetical protein H8356DRAFT_1625102 [Neocallimastix sp. JGI-2020a]ORY75241.1 hypothetical protein LY90DRAFT_665975 [Neocallimastix californiae]|eukprot:ORY75241.1 hypothetical protein LY90DRAFT_665975 [Neocallimastix californiae]